MSGDGSYDGKGGLSPRVGIVIPVGEGREQNLWDCLIGLQYQKMLQIVCVFDGPAAWIGFKRFVEEKIAREHPDPLLIPESAEHLGPVLDFRVSAKVVVLDQKHAPGQEQPRNVGVRHLREDIDWVWFVDSDVVFEDDCLDRLTEKTSGVSVVIGPYEWMPPGHRSPLPELHNDPRWAMFNEERWNGPLGVWISIGELNVGLACFSGNLLWRRKAFEKIGGFWSEIHHGRCEDGELGLRAVAEGIPITCAPLGRGYHMYHDINSQLAVERNARDVPMLNARHPWVEGSELFVVERDGKRFEERCPSCHQLINTGEIWNHLATCQG